jgi:hypothetical protein
MLTLKDYTLKQLQHNYSEEYKKQIVSLAVQVAYFEMYGLDEKAKCAYDELVINTGLNFYFQNYNLL